MRFISIFVAVIVSVSFAVVPAFAGDPAAINPVPQPSSCGDCYWSSYAMGKGADAAMDAWISFDNNNTCAPSPYISWRTIFLGAISKGEAAESKLFQAYSANCDCQLATQGLSNAESAMLYVNAALEASELYCTQTDPWVSEMMSAQNWYQPGIVAANTCKDQSCGITE